MSLWDGRDGPVRAPGLAGFSIVACASWAARPSKIDTRYSQWRERSGLILEQTLAYHFRVTRAKTDVPQWALAERMGRAQSFIAKLETDRPGRHMHVCELVQLCVLMQHDPCTLLTTVVEQPSVRDILAAAPPYHLR